MSDKTSDKIRSPLPSQPLGYPLWLAFVSAGLCFISAGYLGSSGGAWRELYETMGVMLPLIQVFVMENPITLPLGLIAIGVLSLALTRVRLRSPQLNRSLTLLCRLGGVGAGLLACMFVYVNVLVLQEMQRALQQ